MSEATSYTPLDRMKILQNAALIGAGKVRKINYVAGDFNIQEDTVNNRYTIGLGTVPSGALPSGLVKYDTAQNPGPHYLEFEEVTAPGAAPASRRRAYLDPADSTMRSMTPEGISMHMEAPRPTDYKIGWLTFANAAETGHGLFDGHTKTHATVSVTGDADGIWARQTTGTVNPAHAARHIPATFIRRNLYPRLEISFRMSGGSGDSQNLFIGFIDQTTLFTGNAPTSLQNVVGIGCTSSSTNFSRFSNDGAGGGSTQSIGVSRNATWNKLIIRGDEANSRWTYSFNGGAVTDFVVGGADAPGATALMAPMIDSQNGGAVDRNLDLRWAVLGVKTI